MVHEKRAEFILFCIKLLFIWEWLVNGEKCFVENDKKIKKILY